MIYDKNKWDHTISPISIFQVHEGGMKHAQSHIHAVYLSDKELICIHEKDFNELIIPPPVVRKRIIII